MLNKRLIYKFTDLFTGISRHNKRDFDTDYNDFVVAQDELSILADRAKSEDSLNMFLAHVDESVTGFCKYACDNHEYLSKAIQNAYLIENKKAQVEGNTSFGDVAYAVYKKFEGRITPEEFIGSSVYIECFTGKKFADALADKMQGVDVEASRYLDTPELDKQPYSGYKESDYYYLGGYESAASIRESFVDMDKYAEKISDFSSKYQCGQFATDTLKARMKSHFDFIFDSSASVGGNLKLLNKLSWRLNRYRCNFDDICGSHVMDSVMRDKLADVAGRIAGMGDTEDFDKAYTIAGFALEKIYRNYVGKFAGYKVIKSFCENDKIDNSIKSDAYSKLKAFMPYKLRDKYAKQFGDHELEDAQPLDFENGFSERHQYKRLIRYAELYKTSKSLTKDIQRVISDGVDAGVSYNKLKKQLDPYDKKLFDITYYFDTKVQGSGCACDAFADGMDNSSVVDVYKSASKKLEKKMLGTFAERDEYMRKSLDKHLIYKSFMSGCLHDLTFKYCAEMKDVAKGFNTLSSKFGMSFDAFHLNDIVDTFNTGLAIDHDFRPNLNVKEASTSKCKVLKQLDSDALSNETSYDI